MQHPLDSRILRYSIQDRTSINQPALLNLLKPLSQLTHHPSLSPLHANDPPISPFFSALNLPYRDKLLNLISPHFLSNAHLQLKAFIAGSVKNHHHSNSTRKPIN